MKILEHALRSIVIAGIFLLPFICFYVSSSLFFPYITGKNFAFRIIVELITGAWLALALVRPEYRPRRSSILAALAFFVVIIGIADLQGLVPFKSFWSNFERMDGWVTLIHLLAFTVVAASVVSTEKLWRWLFRVALGVSVVLALYGFLQVAGQITLGGGGATGLTSRIDATFGNPIYLAIYMLFHIFIAALLWHQEWRERTPGSRLPISILYGAVILVDTGALLFTGTRGTMLGLIGGSLIALIAYALSSGTRRIKFYAVGSIVAVVVLGGLLVAARDTAFVHSVVFLDRLASISLQDTTTRARLINMQTAWQGVKERPMLGWGQENYALVFDKYYDPRMYSQEQWFDRTHNIVFDWMVAGGILGLLAYLSIFAAALWTLWRSSNFSSGEQSILTGLLLGYFCHNFFVFDNVTSYIFFGVILAFIAYRSSQHAAPLFPRWQFERSALPYSALIGGLFLAIVVPWVNMHALAANKALIAALVPQQGGIAKNLALFKEAIAYESFGTQEAREQLAQLAVQLASANGIALADKRQFAETAAAEMQLQEQLSPLDARFPLFLSMVFDAYGAHADAAGALQRALEDSPRKQSIYLAMAQNAELRGDHGAALSFYKSAFELELANDNARYLYAGALVRAGKSAEAIALVREKITQNSQTLQAYVTLAAMYYQGGNKTQAIAALEEAKKAIPEAAGQIDPLIEQVRSGTVQI